MANTYFTCTLEAWASGSTIYANMHYYRADGLTYPYQDTSFPAPTMTIAGTSFSDTDFANRVHNGINVGDVYTTQFSKTVGGDGVYNVSFSAGSGYRSDFAGSWSTTVTVSGQSSPPTGLKAENITPHIDGFSADVSITDWGTGLTSGALKSMSVWTYDSSSLVEPRRVAQVQGTNLSDNVTVNNSSDPYGGTLNIIGNTRYAISVYATNGSVGTGAIRQGDYHVTLAKTATITVSSLTQNSATFAYDISADGGFYAKTYEYSLDGMNWTTFATVASGSATSGTINLTGLDPHTAYTLLTRVTTTAGVTIDSGTNFRTVGTIATYGAVPVQTITGVTGEIRAGGAGNVSSFDGATFWSAAQSVINPNKEMDYLWFNVSVYPDKATLYLYYKDGTYTSLPGVAHYADAAIYGLSGTATAAGTDYIDLTPVYSTSYVSAKTRPWYGSVNSQSALIQKIYGSVGGVAKRVY